MGKIFDALEKANHGANKGEQSRLHLTGRKLNGNNVVPLKSDVAIQASSNIDQTIIAYHNPESVEAEAFKILRTNILFPKEGKPPKTILVTSAVPGEGKSFTSANLAVSIAQGLEDHVLLIDCDMRKFDIQELFGFRDSPGLSEYLSKGNMALNTLLLKTPVSKLSLLASGKQPHNPTELLSSKKMAELIVEVKNRYSDRYIIIDSPPPVVASETIAIANHVDGIIIVVKERGAERKAVQETLEMLDSEKILGIVLNWSQRKKTKYYYGYSKYGKKI